ncbi:FAD-dependent monooxygenase [Streptomyces sp. GESEQ-35]|uniref:FAD-dependent monooxygenase n=1 Tax=Streptomyces sp. GESEQ-35 TaxID=2812657 RepID=UPI001B32739A|nr:FAD-dependent monooxygenase [Streptomyces sp. GESEQ-35]
MASRTKTQVMIVGGGPVGMLLAAELAGYGVRTLVLESETEVSRCPKATTLHARTVQCLVRRGHLDGLEAAVDPAAFTRAFHFAGLPGLAISAPAAEPEPVMKCPQEELQRHFEKRARAAGARVLRGHRVTGVRQGPAGVRVTAQGPHGQVDCAAQYLVGADGARSTVREQTGFASRTYSATVSAMAGDVRLVEAASLGPGWHCTPRGWLVAKDVPGGGLRLRTLNCTGAQDGHRRPPTLEELRGEVSWIAGRDIAMEAPRWLSRFSDFSRLARSFRAGRIFLAGDAAHVHFPIGGQGLSTGLLDAVNLGWKLALTVQGGAGRRLLDSYDQERRPAAQRVIDNTRAQLALMRPGPELEPLRALFTQLLATGGEASALGAMVSAQDTMLAPLTAQSSPWEGRFLHNVGLNTPDGPAEVIGLLREGRPLLLLFGERGSSYQEQARGWAGVVRTVHAAPTPELPCEALLVRPDGYVAWGPDGDGLDSALAAYFGESRGTTAGPADTEGRLAEPVS